MFDKFTQRAQKVIRMAQEEARKMNYPYVATEHLLLGIINEGESVAAKVLENLGIDSQKVREKILELVGPGEGPMPAEIAFTPRAKRVLELSVDEAARFGHNYVGTEHLLLGLIREGEGVAARVLVSLGADLERVRTEITQVLSGGPIPGTSNQAGGQAKKKTVKTPTLDEHGRDLTALARENKLDPVVGREKEIERVIQVLSRRTKNNPVLIGEPGVGKTAIVEGLAQRIVQKKVPEILIDKRVVTLDLASMVAGTKYRGEFEERLKKVLEEIKNAGNIIVFIDEIHTLIGAGAAEGAIDAANILKPSLARGEIQCVGATTLDEYRKYIEKDPALERRFQPIMVDEPTVEETIEILKGLRDRYEAHHRVKITDEAIVAAAKLSDRYITDRFLPDKAIDLIDEAASRVRLNAFTAPPNLKELEEKINEIRKEKEAAVAAQEFEKAAKLRDQEQKLKAELEEKKKEWEKEQSDHLLSVTEDDIAQIVSQWTGIPVKKLAEEESERLLKLEEILHQRVIGQDEAVKAVARAVRRARAGLKDPKRPIGSFIFLGPTGVGKTELARALAEALFGDEDALIRIDMSEYMEKHTVARLIGAPPGYVGYEEGGQLTEAVRRKPYSVILLDEIEKAHPEVFNILLQVLEDGRLTDSKGRTVDFKNTVIIMTSNIGAHLIKKEARLGFKNVADGKKDDDVKEKLMAELKRTFRPEFLNRIDEIIVFHSLTEEHLKEIVRLMLKEVAKRLEEQEMKVEFDDSLIEVILKEGYDEAFGARPLRRAIQKIVEDKLSEELLLGNIKKGDSVKLYAEDGQIKVAKI
ncbi:ATP-dependent Clp protease ATP-binding subunit ClpC [Carboxydothermus islandicus]|uniref:ATP-dependent Clp protease ATP-binding subunit ClpC n=1 Tax=Carboxydothermus islandicus TaxID=661089 RepID=A0A1L8CZT2_9THEO|nr:ATP-dependent Clp protease ATP-binding subunit [Carboxydothermus islandicus]GAV24371.1 ATP-dependent Clp protease ATP-binding subunit ClpC [Carboxydothermus islandicus]